MATKRKQEEEANDEGAAKRNSMSYNARTPGSRDAKPTQGWRTLGERAVQPSLPLSNMVSALQDLIDPEFDPFDPLDAVLDDEPRFLKPLPSRIALEDLEFLRFRGALSIPESGLRNELLRCYIQWVHSFLPVLNLQEFLRCVAENDPNGNVSILLFQAVMFVATAFIDLKHLQAAGYATRKSARSAFYTRLRLLYSLDCEENRIEILQTVLLMTYYSDHENSPQRDIWDWIGVCNTQAHSIGLNRDPSTASNMDVSAKQLRTRLWWSLYARDRLIAMGLRRPTQVNEGTCNVPMLKLEDFDYEPFHPSVLAMFYCRQLEDVSHQKRLATMFVEKVKLCQWIGRVLFAQYTPSQRNFGTTTSTTITLVPRQAAESELARCSHKLDSWVNGLPKDAQFLPAPRNTYEDGDDVLLLHSAMLRMLYHAIISALYRPWAMASTKEQTKPQIELANTARARMHDAAAGITNVLQALSQLNLTRFLPQTGVTVILPAAVAHLTNTTSENPAVRETSIHNFQRCVETLHRLKEIYPAADMEAAHIEAAVRMQSGSESGRAAHGASTTSPTNFPRHTPPTQEPQMHDVQITRRPSSTQNQPPDPQPQQPPSHDTFLSPDIFAADFDLTEFSADTSTSNPGYPEVDLNWTEELLREARFTSYPDAGVAGDEAPVGEEGTLGTANSEITGDLDRDLGLGDDF